MYMQMYMHTYVHTYVHTYIGICVHNTPMHTHTHILCKKATNYNDAANDDDSDEGPNYVVISESTYLPHFGNHARSFYKIISNHWYFHEVGIIIPTYTDEEMSTLGYK